MTQIAFMYAQALYDLAEQEQLTEQVYSQLRTLEQGIAAEPQFLRFLSAPNVSKQERCSVLDQSFRDKVHPYVLNFFKLLTQKGYARHFPECCKAYARIYNEAHGILPVTAVTAVELTREQSQRLEKKLQELTGKQILLNNRLDPGCLGGIRLIYDGKQIDGTVRSRLTAVGKLLKNTVL